MNPDTRWWATLRAAWRVRRPEFFRAELPIFLVPACLTAPSLAALLRFTLFEAIAIAFLLFNVGDVVNCWFDRDLDLHRKTHLAEAVARMGRRGLVWQIAVSALVAAILSVHLARTLRSVGRASAARARRDMERSLARAARERDDDAR